jgi:hypothetical protein
MSHNVPAVYDVFASPMKETVGFQGLQKCGWSVAWEWSVAERPSHTEPRAAYWRRSIYSPVMRSVRTFYFFHNVFL